MVKKLTEEEIQEIKNEVNKEVTEGVKPIKKDKYELVEVPTQTSIMIREVGTENVFDEKSLLLNLANDIAAIKKAIA